MAIVAPNEIRDFGPVKTKISWMEETGELQYDSYLKRTWWLRANRSLSGVIIDVWWDDGLTETRAANTLRHNR